MTFRESVCNLQLNIKIMKNEVEKLSIQQGNGVSPYVISCFFKDMAEKYNVEIGDLNLHIDGKTLHVQEYIYGGYPEFKSLEMIDLNGL